MSTEIAKLESAGLAITADATPEQCAELLVRIKGFMSLAKAAEKVVMRHLIEWCEANRRGVPGGDGSYWTPSYRTDKSCTDPKATAAAILEHASLETLMECLAAQAFKPGACKAHLPDEVYAELFREEVKATLKDGGKAEKQLVKVDPQFVKQRPRQGASGEQVL